MKNWFKILLPVVIVLTSLVLGQKILRNKNNQPIKSSYSGFVTNIKESSVSKIVIKDSKSELILDKNGQDWFLGDGKKADGTKVKQLLSIILTSDSNYELISQNPKRSQEFGLATTSATVKKITLGNSNQPLLSIWIGRDSYPGTFIQIENPYDNYFEYEIPSSWAAPGSDSGQARMTDPRSTE